jgi:hypothetical protein
MTTQQAVSSIYSDDVPVDYVVSEDCCCIGRTVLYYPNQPDEREGWEEVVRFVNKFNDNSPSTLWRRVCDMM